MRRTTTASPLPRTLARCAARVATAIAGAWLALLLAAAPAAHAQGVELSTLELRALDHGLALEFSARLTLSGAIEDALRRGVPMYFDVEAALRRSRWWWRDERVAQVARTYRLSYQPLTSSWRVGLGALGQSYATLPDALAVISRVSGWRLTDGSQLEDDQRYYVVFSYRLDSSQLPQPLQIGLGNDWSLGITRTVRVDPRVIDAARH